MSNKTLSHSSPSGSLRKNYLKNPVETVAVANVDIHNPPAVISLHVLSRQDRVLLTAQTNATENGVYGFNGDELVPDTDFASYPGELAPVTSGAYEGMTWQYSASVGWFNGTLGTVELNNLRDHYVQTRNGTKLTQHQTQYQLSDFGPTVVDPLTAPFPNPAVNNADTWALNNAALKDAFASGRFVYIPKGRYYISDTLLAASYTTIAAFGGEAEIIYGPAWSGTFLEAPLVELNGTNTVTFESITFHGVYHTRRVVHIHGLSLDTKFDNCNIYSSAPTHFALDCGYFLGLDMSRCRISAGAFGMRTYNEGGGLSQFIFATSCYISGNYIGLQLDSLMIAQFIELTNDAEPGPEWAQTGPVPTYGIYSPNDVKGFYNVGAYSVYIAESHQENSQTATKYGTGFVTNVGSAVRMSGFTAPGWHQYKRGPFAEAVYKVGVQDNLVRLNEQGRRGTECWFLGSTAGGTWDPATMSVTTTAGVESIARFAIGAEGSAPKQLTKIEAAINVGGGVVTTSVLELCYVDNTTGAVTVAASFTLANGDNSFSANEWNRFTNYWDGWCGTVSGPSGYDLKRTWFIQIRLNSTNPGAIRLPRVQFNASTDGSPTTFDATSPLVWVPGWALCPAPNENTAVNIGSTAQSIANGSVVTRVGSPTLVSEVLITGNGLNYYHVRTPAVASATFAMRARIIGAFSSPFSVFGDVSPGTGYGFFVGKIGVTWQIYAGGGFTNTGVGHDNNWHNWVFTYNHATNTINVYLDGSLIGTRAVALIVPANPRIMLGSYDGTDYGAGVSLEVKSPVLISGVASADALTFINACLTAIA